MDRDSESTHHKIPTKESRVDRYIIAPVLGSVQPFFQKGQVIITKLPNRYGSISKLSGNRRRPYVVRKSKEGGGFTIVGYAATREEGLALLAQYNANPWDVDRAKITLQGLYSLWLEKKAPKLGKANQDSLRAAFKHCSALLNRPYKEIKAFEMQDTIDGCGRGYSTQGAIKNLWTHLTSSPWRWI